MKAWGLDPFRAINMEVCSRGGEWSNGTYSGVKEITMMTNQYSLTSVQLHYGLDGDESLSCFVEFL